LVYFVGLPPFEVGEQVECKRHLLEPRKRGELGLLIAEALGVLVCARSP
jgi:hypothetical protein